MAYNDLVTDVASFTTQASAASSDLAGVVAGADVLATQFDSLKSTVDSLSIALNELTGGQYTVLKDTAAARPVTPSTGQLFFASDTRALSLYGGSWGVVSPTGIVSPFAGATAPEGWLLCDGSVLNSTATPAYAALFSVIGTSFGGSGAAAFNLPNLLGRSVVGAGAAGAQNGVAGSGALTGGTALTARALGAWFGDEALAAHAHTASSDTVNLAHSHAGSGNTSHNTTGTYVNSRATFSGGSPFNGAVTGPVQGTNGSIIVDPGHSHTVSIGTDSQLGSHGHVITVNSAGAGAQANFMPSLGLTYIIKV